MAELPPLSQRSENNYWLLATLGEVALILGENLEAEVQSSYKPVMKNTWGDALYYVFSNVRDAGLFALEVCDLVQSTDWEKVGLPASLNLRVALHTGVVYKYTNPITGDTTYSGTHVNYAARIEPITPPGKVYSSQEFAAMVASEGVKEFTCDYVGKTPLAKGYGTFPTYHVRPSWGEGMGVDRKHSSSI
ncbi:MAG: hypothetical protein F6K18_14770 [Okeania sp. SIO2C2]|nr:hypothetical protein [Okeania sp. SIO2C2]